MLVIPETIKERSGIYAIVNSHNNKRYIGQSLNVRRRLRDHINVLNHFLNGCDVVDSYYLQNSYKKYNGEGFYVEVIEYCSKDILDEREKYWISYYDSHCWKNGYNLTDGGQGHPGTRKTSPHYESMVQKIRNKNKGRIISEWQKQRISEANRNPSPEKRKQMSERRKGSGNSFYGKKHTPETRTKMSMKAKQRPGVWTGKKLSEQHKKDAAKSRRKTYERKVCEADNILYYAYEIKPSLKNLNLHKKQLLIEEIAIELKKYLSK